MQAHSHNALQLATWLQEQPGIQQVYYAGLTSHPQHELAARQQQGFGGLLAFDLAGGQAAAWRFINATRMISITANLGDTKSTITHPATTTHDKKAELNDFPRHLDSSSFQSVLANAMQAIISKKPAQSSIIFVILLFSMVSLSKFNS